MLGLTADFLHISVIGMEVWFGLVLEKVLIIERCFHSCWAKNITEPKPAQIQNPKSGTTTLVTDCDSGGYPRGLLSQPCEIVHYLKSRTRALSQGCAIQNFPYSYSRARCLGQALCCACPHFIQGSEKTFNIQLDSTLLCFLSVRKNSKERITANKTKILHNLKL